MDGLENITYQLYEFPSLVVRWTTVEQGEW